MLKIIGILILCTAVSGVGFVLDAQFREKINRITKTERLVEYIHCRIQYMQTDIFTLFASAAEETEFKELCFLSDFSELKLNWSAKQIKEKIPEKFPQWELMVSFFAGLGQTDIVGQLEHCEIYRTLFAEKRENYLREYASKGKVYRALGAFFAAGLAIVLI